MKASRGTSALGALLMAGCVAVASFCLPGSAAAADVRLSPQTKVRLTVVQWMPMKGQYERWEALGGEFIVSDAGTLSLPVIGSVPVGTLDNAGLAAEISKRLQAKTGMVAAPDTTVEVVEYPPIYVVGDVNTPGQYKFREGLTVLQALALSGGEIRSGAHSETEARCACPSGPFRRFTLSETRCGRNSRRVGLSPTRRPQPGWLRPVAPIPPTLLST